MSTTITTSCGHSISEGDVISTTELKHIDDFRAWKWVAAFFFRLPKPKISVHVKTSREVSKVDCNTLTTPYFSVEVE